MKPFILVLFATMLVACSRGPVVSVTNRSNVTISNAAISGPRFTNALGTLRPGEERKVVVRPRGESHVRLTFEVGGRKVDSGGKEYFEDSPMYHLSLTVTTNLEVQSSSSIKR